jgi:hypothetical protein
MKEVRVVYEVGDLVKIQDKYALDRSHPYANEYNLPSHQTNPVTYGLVVGRTIPWHEAYNVAGTVYEDDSPTRYWDNVNYAPYHVMVLGEKRKLEWVSPEYMELIG